MPERKSNFPKPSPKRSNFPWQKGFSRHNKNRSPKWQTHVAPDEKQRTSLHKGRFGSSCFFAKYEQLLVTIATFLRIKAGNFTRAVSMRALTGFNGAALGTTNQPTCVVPIATTIARAIEMHCLVRRRKSSAFFLTPPSEKTKTQSAPRKPPAHSPPAPARYSSVRKRRRIWPSAQ